MISTRKRDVKLKSGTIIDTVILVPPWYCTNYYSCPSHAGRKYRSMW